MRPLRHGMDLKIQYKHLDLYLVYAVCIVGACDCEHWPFVAVRCMWIWVLSWCVRWSVMCRGGVWEVVGVRMVGVVMCGGGRAVCFRSCPLICMSEKKPT